ncbi:GNAT family N-acetyltransferase [Priestia taiwanensis]|uniref:Acetyltransferase n=1 Tax=Priestia taiwanensis TaxID=1347902 RepID=A0A917ANR1_9BACI|nr:GNAT family N-acetyltransferase [Priestia taiwanensis]MBM7362439.1 putative acetyltransferase [Priestia taiwanensis]GGE62237.1 acetyltransferase [Priestia taiwanensis]
MELTIRPIQLKDATDIHRIAMQEDVFPYLVFLPSMRIDMMENRIKNLSATQYEFVAEHNGNVVGWIGLVQGQARRSHVGDMYIAVDSSFHNNGIGSALLTKIINLADNWLLLERVDLTVLHINPKAKALYEKFGFVEEGRKKGSLKTNGTFADEIVMGRLRPNGLLQRI